MKKYIKNTLFIVALMVVLFSPSYGAQDVGQNKRWSLFSNDDFLGPLRSTLQTSQGSAAAADFSKKDDGKKDMQKLQEQVEAEKKRAAAAEARCQQLQDQLSSANGALKQKRQDQRKTLRAMRDLEAQLIREKQEKLAEIQRATSLQSTLSAAEEEIIRLKKLLAASQRRNAAGSQHSSVQKKLFEQDEKDKAKEDLVVSSSNVVASSNVSQESGQGNDENETDQKALGSQGLPKEPVKHENTAKVPIMVQNNNNELVQKAKMIQGILEGIRLKISSTQQSASSSPDGIETWLKEGKTWESEGREVASLLVSRNIPELKKTALALTQAIVAFKKIEKEKQNSQNSSKQRDMALDSSQLLGKEIQDALAQVREKHQRTHENLSSQKAILAQQASKVGLPEDEQKKIRAQIVELDNDIRRNDELYTTILNKIQELQTSSKVASPAKRMKVEGSFSLASSSASVSGEEGTKPQELGVGDKD